MNRFNTPILFIIFNRPDLAKITFSRIREVKPKRLFIAADGPRSGNNTDVSKCLETKKVVLDMIDWECELKTLFREENLGCGRGPADAISWFFNDVEEGIILEDDCLASHSFFTFCEYLLEKYKNETKVAHISGNTFIRPIFNSESYRISNYTHSWGWATWSNRWQNFQYNIDENDVEKVIDHVFLTTKEKIFWKSKILGEIRSEKRDVWDYQWMFNVWKNGSVSILPNYNLVTNIGFGEESTHTKLKINQLDSVDVIRLTGISNFKVNRISDLRTMHKHFKQISIFEMLQILVGFCKSIIIK